MIKVELSSRAPFSECIIAVGRKLERNNVHWVVCRSSTPQRSTFRERNGEFHERLRYKPP